MNYNDFIYVICPNVDCGLVEDEVIQGLKELVEFGLVEIVGEVVCPECDEFLGEFSLEDLYSLNKLECEYCGHVMDKPKEFADFIIRPTESGMEFFREYKDKTRAEVIQRRLKILIQPIFAGF